MTKEKAEIAAKLLEKITDLETLVSDIEHKGFVGIFASSMGVRFYSGDEIYASVYSLVKYRLDSLKEEFDAL